MKYYHTLKVKEYRCFEYLYKIIWLKTLEQTKETPHEVLAQGKFVSMAKLKKYSKLNYYDLYKFCFFVATFDQSQSLSVAFTNYIIYCKVCFVKPLIIVDSNKLLFLQF